MLCGLTRLVSRIKWWLVKPFKCNGICWTCPYYDICVNDK
nr:MAG TPA: outer capsid protein sigma-1 attachment protein [Caudoviricetes sp.]